MEKIRKFASICERAENDFGKHFINKQFGSRMSRMIDLESADQLFNLRLDDLLAADDENFYHDVFGIWRESDRSTYPATFGLFVPRFAAN